MGHDVKNVDVERLAGEAASGALETKTAAVPRSRLQVRAGKPAGRGGLREHLERNVWPLVPPSQLGRVLSREEEDAILGHGPE
jgi:antitoxin VapB